MSVARFDGVLLDEQSAVGHHERTSRPPGVSGSHEITLEAVDSIGKRQRAEADDRGRSGTRARGADGRDHGAGWLRMPRSSTTRRSARTWRSGRYARSISTPAKAPGQRIRTAHEREWPIGSAADGAHEPGRSSRPIPQARAAGDDVVTVAHPDSVELYHGPSIFNPLFGRCRCRDGMTLTGRAPWPSPSAIAVACASAAVRLMPNPCPIAVGIGLQWRH